ncbi:hypothetical protein ACGFSB_34210 [Streptomyces sp. NPDC048441]
MKTLVAEQAEWTAEGRAEAPAERLTRALVLRVEPRLGRAVLPAVSVA